MFKNTANQQWIVFAFQDEGGANPGEPITGDALNITANVRIDAGAANAVDDTNPTELEGGYYSFGITAAESNGDSIVISPVSATANVNVIGVPGAVWTRTDLSGVEAKIDTAQTDLDTITGAAGVIIDDSAANDTTLSDAIWDETLTGSNHNDANSAGRRLRQIDVAFVVTEGTADAGAANTIDLETGIASTTDDIYNGDRVMIIGGTGAGEHGIIIDYDGATNQRATMAENWVVTPDATSEYILVPADADVESWQHVVVSNGATSGLPAVDAQAISDNTAAADNVQANIGNLDGAISTAQADLDILTGADGVNLLSATQASIDAIEADTNELQGDWVNTGRLDTILDELTTNVDAVEADTQDIQGRLPSVLIGGRMDSDVEAINNSTTAAIQLALSAAEIESGACEGTPSTTVVQTDLAETQDDIYIGRTVIFTSGNARGEATDITDYAGATGTLTVTALANAPAAADTFILL
jgi:hypothetical protein